MASLFADENFPLPVVRQLRMFGHDVLTAIDAGMVNRRIPDTIVLEYATLLGRAVVTSGLGGLFGPPQYGSEPCRDRYLRG